MVQSLLPGSPSDLTSEGEHLSSVLQTVVPADSEVFMGLNEACPACKAEVPLQDITAAVCPRGHTWRASPSFPSLRPSLYFLWLGWELTRVGSFVFVCSPLLDHDVHPRDAPRADVRGLQPQGVPAAVEARPGHNGELAARGGPGVGG